MSVCSGIRADGGRCKAQAIRGSAYCVGHDPDQAEARHRRASKGGKHGGRGRPQHETEAIKVLLEDLTERVLSGDLETGRAAVANQLVNTRLRAIEQERKNKETEELAERVEELERRLSANQRQRGRRAW